MQNAVCPRSSYLSRALEIGQREYSTKHCCTANDTRANAWLDRFGAVELIANTHVRLSYYLYCDHRHSACQRFSMIKMYYACAVE